MKEYLLLFWNETGEGDYLVAQEDRQQDMEAWQSWIGQIALQGKLISTKPIAYQGASISNDGKTNSPTIKDNQLVTGYLICKAVSQQEVEEWSQTCPILKYPKGAIEIRSILPFEL